MDLNGGYLAEDEYKSESKLRESGLDSAEFSVKSNAVAGNRKIMKQLSEMDFHIAKTVMLDYTAKIRFYEFSPPKFCPFPPKKYKGANVHGS